MSEFKQKTWHTTDESWRQLEILSKKLGTQNLSATIRYCIQQVFVSEQRKTKKEAI